MSNKSSSKPLDNHQTNGGWKGELQRILNKFALTLVNGHVASYRTREIVCETLFAIFNTLRELGYRTMPRNLGNKHIKVLVRYWYFDRKLAPKTMVTHLTQLRKFSSWIGKDGMVGSLASYLPNIDPKLLEVNYPAEKTKSWTANGVDIRELIERADALDARLGCILRLEWAFGFRIKECLLCDPWLTDNLTCIAIIPSQGKGNRPRLIPMDSPGQRAIIEYIKTIVKKGEKVGWDKLNGSPEEVKKNLKKSYSKYFNLMIKLGLTRKDLGVTGHGLRCEYLEDVALGFGYIPATLGGTNDQMSKEDKRVVFGKVAQYSGHNLPSKITAYCGGSKLENQNTVERDRLRALAAKKGKSLKDASNPSSDSDTPDESDDDSTIS